MIDLEAIKKLLAAASPTPWEWIRWPCESMTETLEWVEKSIKKGKGFKLHGVGARDPDEVTVCLTGNGPKSEANAILLSMVPQILPALLSEVSALRERVGVLEGALRNFVGDGPESWPNQDEQGGCVLCDGRGRTSTYASKSGHHSANCPFILAKKALAPRDAKEK